MNLIDVARRFATVEACLEYLEEVRWADGAYCPLCGSSRKVYHFSDGRRHKCADCRRIFRVTTGTIFSNSPLKMLPQWFMAIWLVTESAKGISSAQLAHSIGVPQSTAWYMLQRIQNVAALDGLGTMLSGDVEVDETYLGGREHNKHRNKRTKGVTGVGSRHTKAVIFGMRQRGGQVRAFHVSTPFAPDLIPRIVDNVEFGSRISADHYHVYNHLDGPYDVGRVMHQQGEYRRGHVSTNSIESFWALLKRCYRGTHHRWSRRHTQAYLDAACFRQNIEAGQRVERLLELGTGNPAAALTYEELTR